MDLTEASFLLSTIVLIIVIVQTGFSRYKIKKTQDMLAADAEMLCRDLEAILTDFDKDNQEELYEIDLSLRSYFNDNSLTLRDLANKLTVRQVWWGSKNEQLIVIGEMLEWLIKDFYDGISDEEERIRVWSQNVPDFHSKYSKSFHSKPITTSTPG